jgi:hypothetical protein
VVDVKIALGSLTRRSVRPAVPALLTSDGPLGAHIAGGADEGPTHAPIRSLGVGQGHYGPERANHYL